MDKRELYDQVELMGGQLQVFVDRLAEIKRTTQEIVEKNTALELENEKLRLRLVEIENQGKSDKTKQVLSKSRQNLQKLYEEGFHVCNVSYGSRRENDEECLLCQGFIFDSENTKNKKS